MARADDIANLFQCIGVSPTSYREMSSLLGTAQAFAQPPMDAVPPGLVNGLEHTPSSAAKRAVPAHVVVVVSGNGGVGKSTVTALLASALNRGNRAYAIDLDPQNAVMRNLAFRTRNAGLVQFWQGLATWPEIVHHNDLRGFCIPYGNATHAQQHEFERTLHEDPEWLVRQLSQLHTSPRDTLVIDTPTGSSVYLDQALAIADLILMVATPDAVSYHALERMEHALIKRDAGQTRPPLRYVINKVDPTRAASLDMLTLMRKRMGLNLLGTIHQDYCLAESLAVERTPLDSLPSTQGGLDLLDLARTLQLALSQPQPTQLSTS